MPFLFKRDIGLPFHGSSYIRTDWWEAWNCISKLLQLSMDGQNFNWIVWCYTRKCRERNWKTVFNLESCGLHIPHDDFRNRCNAAKWNIEDSLSCLRWLFKHSPPRWEDFTKNIGGTQLCPWIFGKCFSCWENTLNIA